MNFLDSFVIVLAGFIALAGVLTVVHWAIFRVIDKVKNRKLKGDSI